MSSTGPPLISRTTSAPSVPSSKAAVAARVAAARAAGASEASTAVASWPTRPPLLSRPLPSGDRTVNASTFGFLFSQAVLMCQGRSQSITELDRKLCNLGHDVGARFLELVFAREKPGKRETKLLNLLLFISSNMWKTLFGKKADGIEKSKDQDNVYMIRDNDPLTNRYISVPRDYAPLNCAAFIAGILRGALVSAGFPCTVGTHNVATGAEVEQTVFVIEFEPECLARDF